MNQTPPLISQIHARRHGLRRWLWAALGILLLSGLLQLSHNHESHATKQDVHECVICQHSAQLDKILPSSIALVAVLLLLLELVLPARIAQRKLARLHTSIRAPPSQLHD